MAKSTNEVNEAGRALWVTRGQHLYQGQSDALGVDDGGVSFENTL